MIKKPFTLLIFGFLTMLLACDSLSVEDKNEDYPVLIKRVDLETLKSLNDEYHQNNNGLICSTLNEYALTGYSRILFLNDENPCLSRTELKKEVQYQNRFDDVAKQSLLQNSKFTGTTEASKLVISQITPLKGCTICEGPDIDNVPLQWKFEFEPQKINNIEVSNTKITVYMDANGVNRIWGNWYNVIDPGFVEFGTNHVKEYLIGLKLRYANEQNQIFEQIVSKEHIQGEPELRFTAIDVEEGMEIHKAWEVNILLQNTDSIKWKVYVSTVSGTIIDTTLL